MGPNENDPETGRLTREAARLAAEAFAGGIMEIGRRCAALPVIDSRRAEDILGYDRDGLPA